MARKIIWNHKAAEQFESIQNYLLVEFGTQAVKKITSRTFKFLELREKYPFLGRIEFAEKDISERELAQDLGKCAGMWVSCACYVASL